MRATLNFRYIPKDAQPIEHPLGVVYAYQSGARPAAIAYRGTGNKAVFHHSYVGKDPETLRQNAINSFFSGLEKSENSKLERRAESKKPHTIAVGTIVYNSWGYDQTNVDFYEVVKTSGNYVWLQRLAESATENGFMSSSNTMPQPGTSHGAITQHRVKVWQSGQSVTFKHGSGSIWDGKPKYSSWYA